MWSDILATALAVGPDLESAEVLRRRADLVLRPRGALERLDDLAIWLAAWQRRPMPSVDHPVTLIFGGDHGVVEEGVSAFPDSVTAGMLESLRSGVATASVMARRAGALLEVIDVGVGKPTGNIMDEPALSLSEFERALDTGVSAVERLDRVDLLIPGEIGIGNTTPAAAICLALFGGEARDWVGPGTGLGPEGVARKVEVVAEAVRRAGTSEPSEVLRQLGGWELAAIAGAVIEARRRSIPVLLDGFVVTAALMPLHVAHPGALDHCWPGHVSPEPGHARLVDLLGKPPLLDLKMRLGEASGALAALPLVALAADALVRVATFEEAGLG